MRLSDKIVYALVFILGLYSVGSFYYFSDKANKEAIRAKQEMVVQINQSNKAYRLGYEQRLKLINNEVLILNDSLKALSNKSMVIEKSINKHEKTLKGLYEKRNSILLSPDSLPRF